MQIAALSRLGVRRRPFTKTMLVMKFTAILLLATCLQVSAKVFSQSVTFSGKDVPLQHVFNAVKDQTGYVFFFDEDLLHGTRPVTISAKNMLLPAFLKEVLKTQPLTYSIQGKTIFLSKAPAPLRVEQVYNVKVSGIVYAPDRQPLPGASVRVKGTATGTEARDGGLFTLDDVNDNAVLQITSVGFHVKEVSIARLKAGNDIQDVKRLSGDNTAINFEVVLTRTIDTLDAVVINSYSTGYQTLSKERATGAFATVTAGSFKQQRLSSLSSLLEGRVAGYNNGLIRGTTSMNGVTSPLYVIDGFPVENTSYSGNSLVENLPGLNLEDIEKITVLKDAAAASIYGARAANGVVVIITKKAKKGKPQINASSTFTVQPYKFYPDRLASSADMVDLEKEWATNNPNFQGANAATYANSMLTNNIYYSQGVKAYLNYYAGKSTQQDLNTKLDQLSQSGYKYYDDLANYAKRNTFLQQYNVSVANASDKNAFYSSVTYRDNALEDKFSANKNLGLNLRNTAHVTNWLDVELSTYLQYYDEKAQGPLGYNALTPGYNYLPYDQLINEDGSHYTSAAASRLSANTMNIINQYKLYSMDITPLDEIGMNLGRKKSFMSRSYAKLDIKFAKWLNYQVSFQYENNNERFSRLYDKNSYYVRNRVNGFAQNTAANGFQYLLPYGNIYNRQTQLNTAYNFRQQLNFDKTFGGHHNVTAILGSETKNMKLELNNQTQYNYDADVLSYTMVNAASLASASGLLLGGTFANTDLGYDREVVNRFVSFYGNVGYSFDDKYLFTGSLRWDRSNLWGTDSKYQNKPLWSVGLGWNIYKEGFFTPGFVSFLKLRSSYGIGGNIAKNSAPYMTAYYSTNLQLGGTQGAISTRPNPLLSWERTFTGNIGVDFAIYNNRITGSVDYYNKRGKDLLASTQGVPTEGWGYSTYTINNGRMTNHGIETTISADIIRSKDWKWNLSGLIAFNKNKVTYVNVEAPVYFLQMDYPMAFPRVGNAFNAIYSYQWAGLNDKGLPQVYNEKGDKVTTSPTTLQSIVYSGTTVPKYSGSFSSSLDYKNFTFAFLVTYEGGHKIKNTDLPMLGTQYNGIVGGYMTAFTAVNKRITERWMKPGDEATTNVPKAAFAESPGFSSTLATMYSNASINVLNAGNIRLRNISLAYNLPSHIIRKAFVESARLQFNVENVFIIAADKNARYLLGGFTRPNLDGLIRPNYVWGLYLGF
jgi:TonB-linked SusC/RagA family outer membrane protein